MGKRGPKPKPTEEKKRLGNPGRRPLNEEEPKPAGKLEAPKLPAYAKKVWARVVSSMADKVYTPCDAELLKAYCLACYRLDFAQRMYQREMKEVGKVKGGADPARLWKWDNQAAKNSAAIASTGTRLGLDPAARSAIKIPEDKPKGKFGEYSIVAGGKK